MWITNQFEREMKKDKFKIEEMHCAGCVLAIERQLRATPGVKEAEVFLMDQIAVVTYDEGVTTVEKINKAVEAVGFVSHLDTDAPIIASLDDSIVESRFVVNGMSCAGCVASVEKRLFQLSGVESAEVFLLDHLAVVRHRSGAVSAEEICDAINELGYQGTMVQEDMDSDTLLLPNSSETKNAVLTSRVWKVLITGVLALPGIIAHILMLLGIHLELFRSAYFFYYSICAGSIIYFYASGAYQMRAIKQLQHKVLTMDTLVALGTSVAYWYSIYQVGAMSYNGWSVQEVLHSTFFDAVGMIMFFVLFGKYLEDRAKAHTDSSLSSLASLVPKDVMRERGNGYESVALQRVAVGDRLLIRSGEVIPVDGIVEGADALLDVSSMTGESRSLLVRSGEEVRSGGINIGDSFSLRVLHTATDSLLSKVIESVKNARNTKPRLQRLADKIAGSFVLVIVLLALVTFVSWLFLDLGGEMSSVARALKYMVNVLVIACPCAMGLATPTAITVAMGKASKAGILIRDAQSLEVMAKVDDLIFDKTGTLTRGMQQVIGVERFSDDIYEHLFASAEQHSLHPIAKTLVHYWTQNGTTTGENVEEKVQVSEIIGKGIELRYKGDEYRIGSLDWSRSFLTEECQKDLAIVVERIQRATPFALIILTTKGTAPLAIYVLEDAIRSEVALTLEVLHHRGINVHLLSGDTLERTHELAERLSIAYSKGGCTPLDKIEYIKALQNRGKIVAMIGDGINDTPSLAGADVSIAMGMGNDLVANNASMTSVNARLADVLVAFDLSHRTIRAIKMNFVWAFLYNILAIPVAAGIFAPYVELTPALSALAMACSSILVVLNSLTLKVAKY